MKYIKQYEKKEKIKYDTEGNRIYKFDDLEYTQNLKHKRRISDLHLRDVNVGDMVVCINNKLIDVLDESIPHYLTEGKLYKVFKIKKNKVNAKSKIFIGDKMWYYFVWRFRLATPEEIDQYNIEQTANKFNL